MESTKKYLDYILKIQAIAKVGLKYSKDPYALKNYEEVQALSKEMLEDFLEVDFNRPNYFERDVYPTPNVSIRTIILNEKKEVLLVKERSEHRYSLPGGWCDLYDSPSTAAIRECEEEAGVKVEIKRLLGITSRTPNLEAHHTPNYVIVFEASIIENLHQHDHEIEEVAFFPLDQIPKLSTKLSNEELTRYLNALIQGETIYD